MSYIFKKKKNPFYQSLLFISYSLYSMRTLEKSIWTPKVGFGHHRSCFFRLLFIPPFESIGRIYDTSRLQESNRRVGLLMKSSFPGRVQFHLPNRCSLGGSDIVVLDTPRGVFRCTEFSESHSLSSCRSSSVLISYYFEYILFTSSYFMRGGKNVSQAQAITPDEGSRASGSGTHSNDTRAEPAISAQQDISGSSTQPTVPDESNSTPSSNPEFYRDILVECNSLVEAYRRGEVPKATVYVEIQSKLTKALGDDRARSDAAFGSFIATIESHDAEVGGATKRGGIFDPRQRSPSPAISDADDRQSDGEPVSKKPRADESAYAWVSGRKGKQVSLSDNLARSLKLIDVYTVDPKATKRSLVNEPDCPEFPDSEWKNVITGRAVSLDAVLSGQLSTTNDDLKVQKFGDLEISFGAVEPTKLVKNAGDWSIAWNRAVRAIVFAFPHRLRELTSYGEYIINLFSVTHPSVHGRVISFDKAVRKRAGSVRNLELSDFEKFADLKIAHMDSIGVSVLSGVSGEDGSKKGKRRKGWKKQEPCNNWNEGKCSQAEGDCRRQHVCSKCGEGGHRARNCRKS
jgi:hypothetical protein